MVHGALIEAGKVEKLTYRQVRALERIDARKARDSDRAQILRETIIALGRAAEGLFSNQIAGTATFVIAATAIYPLWLPELANAAGTISKAISDAWKAGILPPPPVPPPDTTGSGNPLTTPIQAGAGNYGVELTEQSWIKWLNLFSSGPSVVANLEFGITWFETAQERDAYYTFVTSRPNIGYFVTITKVQR